MGSLLSDKTHLQIRQRYEDGEFRWVSRTCRKAIKKGDISLIVRAFDVACSLSMYEARAIDATKELCASSDFTQIDPDTWSCLKEALYFNHNARPLHTGIWTKLLRAKPHDEALHIQCFRTSVHVHDVETAQLAAMSLQKNFPNKRNYYFLAIFLTYIMATEFERIGDKTKAKIYSTLCYRMLSKAAEDVPTDPKQLLSPPRAIQTEQELQLLVEVYLCQDRGEEAIAVLDSPHLGISSRIGKNSWPLVRTKLEVLKILQDWKHLYKYSKDLLKRLESDENSFNLAQSTDDELVWSSLRLCYSSLMDEEVTKDAAALVFSIAKHQKKSRNAQLERLVFLTHIKKPLYEWCPDFPKHEDEPYPETLLKGCEQFWVKNSNSTCCFQDLRDFVQEFSAEDYEEFSNFIMQETERIVDEASEQDTIAKIAGIINRLKLTYMYELSRNSESLDRQILVDFICKCLSVYLQAQPLGASFVKTDDKPGDDAGILAAMCLVLLDRIDQKDPQKGSTREHLVQAAMLLQSIVDRSQHNYQALLLLTRIFLLLGAGSMAMATFFRLEVRNVQYDTLAYILFTRISTIHPARVFTPQLQSLEENAKNPSQSLKSALTFFTGSLIDTQRMITLAFDNGNYSNANDTVYVQQKLRASWCKMMIHLEKRRIDRLQGAEFEHPGTELIDPHIAPVSDLRDFDTSASFEARNHDSFEHYVYAGPTPRTAWLQRQILIDELFVRLSTSDAHFAYLYRPTPPEIPSEEALAECTVAEMHFWELFQIISDSWRTLQDQNAQRSSEFHDNLGRIPEWLMQSDIENATKQPLYSYASWEYLHRTIITLDGLRLINLFVNQASKFHNAKDVRMSAKEEGMLKEKVEATHQKIMKRAQRLKADIRKEEVVEVIRKENDEPVSALLDKIVGEEKTWTFANELCASWEDAIDGILNICLKK
ncbi:MAG: hypothetical protein M1834_003599 [Cirrosporium novae-zelandiae]|nr:MAG: hypothetical protein M1834_003599 [Cirrosporium novae-zelandiae]